MASEIMRVSDRPSVAVSLPFVNSNLGEHVKLMCVSALFTGLTRWECTEIASCGHKRIFERNDFLFMQGDPARDLVFLISGCVKSIQLSLSGNQALLWISGSGDSVNIQTEPTSCRHSYSASAMEQCHTLEWDYNVRQALLVRYPRIKNNIKQIIADRLRELEERFLEMVTEDVPQRLALVLLRISKQVGKPSAEGIRISISREELSQMIGTTLFTASRILSEWARLGVVVSRRQAVFVCDVERLELISTCRCE